MEDGGKRLNKYISEAGTASRREADRLIEAGKVQILRKTRKNEPAGQPFAARPGDRVYRGDTVFVDGKELPKKEAEKVYYLYHKPAGVTCTADRGVEGNIIDACGIRGHVTYAGRLDKDSSGLMIMTNDGGLADRLMRASSWHEKEYLCTLDLPVTDAFLDAMSRGVKIRIDDDATLRKHPGGLYVTTRPCRVKKVSDRRVRITLTQGYNRQIRRMCAALGYRVLALKRERILSLSLGNLKEGAFRPLSMSETAQLLKETEKERLRGSGPDRV